MFFVGTMTREGNDLVIRVPISEGPTERRVEELYYRKDRSARCEVSVDVAILAKVKLGSSGEESA